MKPRSARITTTLVFLANGFGIGAWSVAIPRLQEGLALSETELGFVLLAFAVGAIMAMPIAGQFAARFGVGRMTAGLGIAFALALAGPASAQGLLALAIWVFVLGAMNGALDVAMNARATIVEARWQAAIMSSFHAAWSLGGLFGAAAGGVLMAAGWSAAAELLLSAVGILVLMLLAAPNGFAARDELRINSLGFALPDASLIGFSAIAFLCMMTEGAVANWSGVYLYGALPDDKAAAAAGYGAFALAMAGCRVIGDRFVQRYGAPAVISLGGGLAAAGFVLILARPSLVTAYLGFSMVGLGLGNIVPVVFSAAGRRPVFDAAGDALTASQKVAMVATAGYAGFLVGPPVIGFSAEWSSLRVALLLLVAATAAIGLMGGRIVAARLPIVPSGERGTSREAYPAEKS